jgi:hypothetical protein
LLLYWPTTIAHTKYQGQLYWLYHIILDFCSWPNIYNLYHIWTLLLPNKHLWSKKNFTALKFLNKKQPPYQNHV